MAAVITEGNPTAGELVTYKCHVSIVENITGVLSVVWIAPNGDIISSGNSTIESYSTANATTLDLMFNPLLTSHSGQYKCQGLLTSQQLNNPSNAVVTQDVIVQSM